MMTSGSDKIQLPTSPTPAGPSNTAPTPLRSGSDKVSLAGANSPAPAPFSGGTFMSKAEKLNLTRPSGDGDME